MRSIDNGFYDRQPDSWWSDDSFMALLRNVLNPPRFAYFRAVLGERFARPPAALRVLDVGCGGGLLAERFAALGCEVTGVDRSEPTLATARSHAAGGGMQIRYVSGDAAALPFDAAQFDVVCCCDVLEHVDALDPVVAEIARVLKPNGVFFFDTINRTWLSRLLAIKLAQDWAPVRFMPRDLHVWEKFIRPRELAASLDRHGLATHEFAGLSPSTPPHRALWSFLRMKLGRISFGELGRAVTMGRSRNMALSYMGYAARDGGLAVA